ncbi:MAG: mechanosensitive ion channel family protein [Rubrivivax sp.]|nr:mechanosensitive ion channel family protein [Rubrivivax sp.]
MSDFLSRNLGIVPWVATLIAIALVTVAVNHAAQFALRRVGRLVAASPSLWSEPLVRSAARPLLVALWAIGLGWMARVLQRESEVAFVEQALALRDVTLVACAAWFLVRLAGEVGERVVARRQAQGEEVDVTTVDALVKLARLAAIVAAVLVVAQTLGFQIAGLLALGGVGGLAVGLAARDLLANFFGGLTIYLDRPFSVGEWIRSPDKSLEGVVEHISWRHTRIRAFNKNPIYVPNAVFTSIVVENPSRMSHRRIRETIGVRYRDFDAVPAIVDDIRRLLREHPAIDGTQTLIVNFTQFGPSSLDILVYAFTTTIAWADYQALKQDLLLAIGRIVAAHGAEIAFPTRTLHVEAEAPAATRPA